MYIALSAETGHPACKKLCRVLLLGTLVLLSACSSIRYYAQSVSGQMALLRQQKPVVDVLADPTTDAGLRQQLEEIQQILDYAHTVLKLPDNGSYRTYADIEREFVVWNVFAAPAYSLEPKRWCYPVIGCTSYRGYFHKASALEYAETLKQSGWEVSVNGVIAYSTLGWFDDPLLNTMLDRQPWEIARLLFHELAHQQIYFADDTDFNEAYAETVALIGLEKWLQTQSPDLGERVKLALDYEDQFYKLMLDARDRFDQLYRSGKTEQQMREDKASLHRQLRVDYQRLQQQWNGDTRYDAWVNNRINNASLSALATYRALVPDFHAVYQQQGARLPDFINWVKQLSACEQVERRQALQNPASTIVC
jgi:predicted aminopeptidase